MLLKKYTSNWIKDFAKIKREIIKELNGVEYRIEHVGSTSVKNLDSKPIIDIDLIYTEQSDWDKIKVCLELAGYYHNGNQGIDDRDVFKRNGKFTNDVLDTIKHHLYVCPINSKALERHILFRNFLIKNDWARLEYQQLKYEIAERSNQDKKKYAIMKEQYSNDFIDLIIQKEKDNLKS